ncbi:MAG: class I SAM-dependent methyltransferase [Vulcanimicrobiaceae bacterium]
MTYVWETLSAAPVPESGEVPYYNYVRAEVLEMIKAPPRVGLDVGCGAGGTGEELKRRYPGAIVHGIELSVAAAGHARTCLDRVLNDNVETLDFAAAGFAPGSIDLVLFPDVLEHLYNPWHLLERLKPFLAPDAHVLASIPNVRNLVLINELIAGSWDYVPAGLLDVTHIRFFTKKSIVELFAQTGYSIVGMGANLDMRISPIQAPAQSRFDVNAGRVTFKQVSAEDLDELRTIQFLIDAVPA